MILVRAIDADAQRWDMLYTAANKLRATGRIFVLMATIAVAATFVPAASAVDLILLSGDPPQELQGVNTYGLVYVDNQIRLVGDTTINADSVYFGPNSSIGTCYIPGDNNSSACTSGRNLTINATGGVTINPSITLQAPDIGAPVPGGSLAIAAGNIALGSSVLTNGRDQGASGNISLSAAGSIETQALTARGAVVVVAGAGGVTVNGDVQVSANGDVPPTSGSQAASGGHIDLSSATGDAFALGSLLATGLNVGSGATAGGNGGSVKLTSRNVRTGYVVVRGGTSPDAAAGLPGSIALQSQGWTYALSTLDATGSNSTNSAASGGGSVNATAGGHVGIAEIKTYGGIGPLGGGGGTGGPITISGASAVLGNLDASGGTGTTNGISGNGGNGGAIVVAAPGSVTLGAVTTARGGTAPRSAFAGLGGTVDVSAGDLTVGFVSTEGGSYSGGSSASPGVSGGLLKLSANGSLTSSGQIRSSGSSASGSADPAHGGGNGGPIILRAASGVLTLGDIVNASGGTGGSRTTSGQPGGPGGHGGAIDVVSALLGPIAGIFADGGEGGDSGDDEGPGGNGGVIRHWGTGDLFSDTFVASNRGGTGINDGIDGARVVESSPINLTIDGAGNLSFQSASPDAEGFHVSRAVGNGPAEIIATTTGTSGIVATSPVCQAAFISVVAFHNFLGWTSAASAPVTWTTQPRGNQDCTDAPVPTIKKILKKAFKKTPKKAVVPRKQLKRRKWRLPIKFRAKGVGSYDLAVLGPRTALRAPAAKSKGGAKARSKAKAKVKVVIYSIARGEIKKGGLRKARVVLKRKARKPGVYTLRLRTFAPKGKAKKTLKVVLEVR